MTRQASHTFRIPFVVVVVSLIRRSSCIRLIFRVSSSYLSVQVVVVFIRLSPPLVIITTTKSFIFSCDPLFCTSQLIKTPQCDHPYLF